MTKTTANTTTAAASTTTINKEAKTRNYDREISVLRSQVPQTNSVWKSMGRKKAEATIALGFHLVPTLREVSGLLWQVTTPKQRRWFISSLSDNKVEIKKDADLNTFYQSIKDSVELTRSDLKQRVEKVSMKTAEQRQPEAPKTETKAEAPKAEVATETKKVEAPKAEKVEAKEEKTEAQAEVKIDPMAKLSEMMEANTDLVEAAMAKLRQSTEKKVEEVKEENKKEEEKLSLKEQLSFDRLLKMTESEALCRLFNIQPDHDIFMIDPKKVIPAGAELATKLVKIVSEEKFSKSQADFFKVYLRAKIQMAQYILRRANPHLLSKNEDKGMGFMNEALYKVEGYIAVFTNWMASWWNSDLKEANS